MLFLLQYILTFSFLSDADRERASAKLREENSRAEQLCSAMMRGPPNLGGKGERKGRAFAYIVLIRLEKLKFLFFFIFDIFIKPFNPKKNDLPSGHFFQESLFFRTFTRLRPRLRFFSPRATRE